MAKFKPLQKLRSSGTAGPTKINPKPPRKDPTPFHKPSDHDIFPLFVGIVTHGSSKKSRQCHPWVKLNPRFFGWLATRYAHVVSCFLDLLNDFFGVANLPCIWIKIYIIFVISLGKSHLLGTIHEPASKQSCFFLSILIGLQKLHGRWSSPSYLQPAKEISYLSIWFGMSKLSSSSGYRYCFLDFFLKENAVWSTPLLYAPPIIRIIIASEALSQLDLLELLPCHALRNERHPNRWTFGHHLLVTLLCVLIVLAHPARSLRILYT